jgi:membrane-associated phospholipid phosphatase
VRTLALAFVAALIAACSDASITAPDAPATEVDGAVARLAPATQAQLASARWNALARDFVAAERTSPPMAARYYALLSVAQQRAAEAAHASDHGRPAPQLHDAVRAAVVSASAEVLAYAFPARSALLRETERADIESIGGQGPARAELSSAQQLGIDAARVVILDAATDGADAVWTPDIPAGPGKWVLNPAAGMPLLPLWGSVRPWLLDRGSQFRPPPPPAFASPAYVNALAEVRRISDTRTPEQLRITQYWADGAGTATPPGHWNAIAADLAERYHLDEERATQMFALLNMALMDAGIACWDAKYTYWLIRPSQADPLITTPVGLPNFPSYVSGHATFSGAAATLLGAVFPSARRELQAMADEAAMSRLYGGIHYRFDNDQGLEVGRKIGSLAVARLGHGALP